MKKAERAQRVRERSENVSTQRSDVGDWVQSRAPSTWPDRTTESAPGLLKELAAPLGTDGAGAPINRVTRWRRYGRLITNCVVCNAPIKGARSKKTCSPEHSKQWALATKSRRRAGMTKEQKKAEKQAYIARNPERYRAMRARAMRRYFQKRRLAYLALQEIMKGGAS